MSEVVIEPSSSTTCCASTSVVVPLKATLTNVQKRKRHQRFTTITQQQKQKQQRLKQKSELKSIATTSDATFAWTILVRKILVLTFLVVIVAVCVAMFVFQSFLNRTSTTRTNNNRRWTMMMNSFFLDHHDHAYKNWKSNRMPTTTIHNPKNTVPTSMLLTVAEKDTDPLVGSSPSTSTSSRTLQNQPDFVFSSSTKTNETSVHEDDDDDNGTDATLPYKFFVRETMDQLNVYYSDSIMDAILCLNNNNNNNNNMKTRPRLDPNNHNNHNNYTNDNEYVLLLDGLPVWTQLYLKWHRYMRLLYPDTKLLTHMDESTTTTVNRNNETNTRIVQQQHQQQQSPPKLLIKYCDSKCGGLYDRLGTLDNLLYKAYRTKRILLIQWYMPMPLETFLQPSYINFTVPKNEDCTIITHENMDNKKDRCHPDNGVDTHDLLFVDTKPQQQQQQQHSFVPMKTITNHSILWISVWNQHRLKQTNNKQRRRRKRQQQGEWIVVDGILYKNALEFGEGYPFLVQSPILLLKYWGKPKVNVTQELIDFGVLATTTTTTTTTTTNRSSAKDRTSRMKKGSSSSSSSSSSMEPTTQDHTYHNNNDCSFCLVWKLVFQPSAQVQKMIDETMTTFQLQPNQYDAVHCRVRHPGRYDDDYNSDPRSPNKRTHSSSSRSSSNGSRGDAKNTILQYPQDDNNRNQTGTIASTQPPVRTTLSLSSPQLFDAKGFPWNLSNDDDDDNDDDLNDTDPRTKVAIETSIHAIQCAQTFSQSLYVSSMTTTTTTTVPIRNVNRTRRNLDHTNNRNQYTNDTKETTEGWSAPQQPICYFLSDSAELVQYMTHTYPQHKKQPQHSSGNRNLPYYKIVSRDVRTIPSVHLDVQQWDGLLFPTTTNHPNHTAVTNNNNNNNMNTATLQQLSYMSIFVDLYIAAHARCIAYGIGNFAYLAAKISGTSCLIRHEEFITSRSTANNYTKKKMNWYNQQTFGSVLCSLEKPLEQN